jgi:hypothetical protein
VSGSCYFAAENNKQFRRRGREKEREKERKREREKERGSLILAIDAGEEEVIPRGIFRKEAILIFDQSYRQFVTCDLLAARRLACHVLPAATFELFASMPHNE